ncbi:hypothetical protein [Endozoicomonas sp. GU-1]|uniref:hypothetical protein n=1 Tax=Endozoicomonas sp. GU-1 TaxID=3009078 RepID=UPI0022B40369|nr:hypothetical protein [Endozoicomonas sp. GU-1]WBA80674.1 hypothetical protein O2T12_20475 [Endozoicomonas sp. GU-1]WBA88239.1 hypothetical protein O3276_09690 [Endozoicomonas sp. GU-1]
MASTRSNEVPEGGGRTGWNGAQPGNVFVDHRPKGYDGDQQFIGFRIIKAFWQGIDGDVD